MVGCYLIVGHCVITPDGLRLVLRGSFPFLAEGEKDKKRMPEVLKGVFALQLPKGNLLLSALPLQSFLSLERLSSAILCPSIDF